MDGGSPINLIATRFVKCLYLPRVKFQNPISITGYNRGPVEVLNTIIKVPLKLGQYQGSALCYESILNSCDILLGKPWQKDNKVVIDDEFNTVLI